jgi:hypothetical protein
MTDRAGVLRQERLRVKAWEDRGLPDPVKVLAEERVTRGLLPGWRHPDRDLVDAFVASHPDVDLPDGWDLPVDQFIPGHGTHGSPQGRVSGAHGGAHGRC